MPTPPRSTPKLALTRRSFLAGSALFGAGAAYISIRQLRHDHASHVHQDERGLEPRLVALFYSDHVIAAGQLQRLPFGLVDQGQVLVGESADVGVEIVQNSKVIDSLTVPSRIVTHDHPDGDGLQPHEHADILRYFALNTTLPNPGIYDLIVDIDGAKIKLPVQAFDPETIWVLRPPQAMPALQSPTVDDARGVEPICTRVPKMCPFHSETVADLLAQGRPLAVLVSTPALCASAYCGPVLESLILAAERFDTISMVHLEVYANAQEVGFDLGDDRLRFAPAMSDLGLDFEPSLFLVGSDGIIRARLDTIYDQDELETALASLS